MIRVRPGRSSDMPQKQGLLHGETGLIAAIIHMAVIDAEAGWKDALDYFESDWYRYHLNMLNLPDTWLPDVLERIE